MSKKKKDNTFDSDWWLYDEILPPDPWAYIVSDFQWSWDILDAVKDFPLDDKHRDIGHFPTTRDSNSEKVRFAVNTVNSLYDKVREKISYKVIDLEFVWHWGEYQKAISILHNAFPQIKGKGGMIEAARLRNDKSDAKMWYALWYEWYKYELQPVKKSRDSFDKYFEDFLTEITHGKRHFPTASVKQQLLKLIEKYKSDNEDLTVVQLTGGFRLNDFNGKVFKKISALAKEKRDELPPVGIGKYPLK